MFDRAAMKDPSAEKSSVFKFEKEIQMCRAMFRRSGVLENPRSKRRLRSVDGAFLHHDLVNFDITAGENYENFKKDANAELKPFFLTYEQEEEYNNVNNWTKDRISKDIVDMINQLCESQKVKQYSAIHEKTKKKKKSELLLLHAEIKEQVEHQARTNTDTPDEIRDLLEVISHDHMY